MPHTSPNDIDRIPFKDKASRRTLRKLDEALGGVAIIYSGPFPDAPQHFLGLNIGASDLNGKITNIARATAASPDQALVEIMIQIDEWCVKGNYPLVVDPHCATDRGTRIFTAFGNAEFGAFPFRGNPANPEKLRALTH